MYFWGLKVWGADGRRRQEPLTNPVCALWEKPTLMVGFSVLTDCPLPLKY